MFIFNLTPVHLLKFSSTISQPQVHASLPDMCVCERERERERERESASLFTSLLVPLAYVKSFLVRT